MRSGKFKHPTLSWKAWVTKPAVGLCRAPKNLQLESEAQWPWWLNCWIYVINLVLFWLSVCGWDTSTSALFYLYLQQRCFLPSSGSIQSDYGQTYSLFSGKHGSTPGLMRYCRSLRNSCLHCDSVEDYQTFSPYSYRGSWAILLPRRICKLPPERDYLALGQSRGCMRWQNAFTYP